MHIHSYTYTPTHPHTLTARFCTGGSSSSSEMVPAGLVCCSRIRRLSTLVLSCGSIGEEGREKLWVWQPRFTLAYRAFPRRQKAGWTRLGLTNKRSMFMQNASAFLAEHWRLPLLQLPSGRTYKLLIDLPDSFRMPCAIIFY